MSSSFHCLKCLPLVCGIRVRDKPTTHVLSFTNLMKVQGGSHLGRCPKLGPRRLLLGEASSQLPTPSGVQISGQRGAGLPSLGCGITTWVPAGFQASQAETGQVLVAQAGAWLSSWVISYTKDFQLARQKGSIRRNQRRRKKVRG